MDDEAAAFADWDQKSKRSANNETRSQVKPGDFVIFRQATESHPNC